MRIVWFGHSTFRLEFADKVVLIDPFLTGNPAFGGNVDTASEGTTHIVLTHGHGDHVGDTIAIAERTGAIVVANYEICTWLAGKGVARTDPMNSGGTTDQGGFTVTLTRADHSSSFFEGDTIVPLGNPHGAIIKAPGEPVVYHMGDTDVFGDLAIIAALHRPEVVMVPIGDRFTMGADGAAYSLRHLLKPRVAIPCHYGSFPMLAGSADTFVAAMEGSGIQVLIPHGGMGVTVGGDVR